MIANVITKKEILQNLASRGFFVDEYTLNDFLTKNKIEAIFEDEQGIEFFDKSTLDFVLNNFFNQENSNLTPQESQAPPEQNDYNLHISQDYQQKEQQNHNPQAQSFHAAAQMQNQQAIDSETAQILNNISLSDGTPLAQKIQTNEVEDYININLNESELKIHNPNDDIFDSSVPQEHKMGILEGAMLASGQDYEPTPSIYDSTQLNIENINNSIEEDFDDMSLLSESYEAQEKFREYVVSELSKKNVDLTPTQGEFKLDIPEEAITTIARAMAKKIAKHVSQICANDAKASGKLADVQEQNKKMEQKIKELEEQNKKLKLLLIESNKNLNSYKPSILGLYKKVKPEKQ